MGRESKVYRVFLSSTSTDLEEYRKQVQHALERMSFQTTRMEAFVAKPKAPLEECVRLAAEADLLVVIVAHRYGWVPSSEQGGDGKKSITRFEVEAAEAAGKPVFAFLVDEAALWTGERSRIAFERMPALKRWWRSVTPSASWRNSNSASARTCATLSKRPTSWR